MNKKSFADLAELEFPGSPVIHKDVEVVSQKSIRLERTSRNNSIFLGVDLSSRTRPRVPSITLYNENQPISSHAETQTESHLMSVEQHLNFVEMCKRSTAIAAKKYKESQNIVIRLRAENQRLLHNNNSFRRSY